MVKYPPDLENCDAKGLEVRWGPLGGGGGRRAIAAIVCDPPQNTVPHGSCDRHLATGGYF